MRSLFDQWFLFKERRAQACLGVRLGARLGARLWALLCPALLCWALAPLAGEASAKPSGEATYAAAHPKREGEVRVHFIDIGQGDSALIEGPTGKRVLIDSGPSQSGAALKAYLRAVGATELDMMINTHPHADHIGNAAALIREMTVRLVLDSGFAHPIKPYQDLLDAVEETKTPIRIARRGRSIDIGGGASLELLGPEEPLISGSRSDPNSNSVVFRLTFGGQSALFTGDAEEETEERLLKSPEKLRAGLLKVAHHGSRHASGDHFLDAVSPVAAVISCSERNRYGHPAPETLGRLERRGVRHWVTALGGSVVAETDGRGGA
jgi:competence protein ComEC